MRQDSSVLISALAGAVGGAAVMLLTLNSPLAARFFTGQASPGGAVPQSIERLTKLSSEEAVVQAVEKSNPAVVSIVVTQDVPIIEQFYEDTPAAPFEDFFGNEFFTPFRFRVPQYRERGTQEQEVGGGSGFLVSADGLIATNRHVVDLEEADYTVFTSDGTKHAAQVVARDPVNDLAIIKIEGTNFPFLEFADSDALKVGQTVIAIGNALAEFQNTVSVGVVSGLSRSILAGDRVGRTEQLEEVIQTDAAINPGNSGGPLLNLEGKVVGVNVAVALGSQNVGFALPANILREVVESVEATGRIVRPFLGVRYTMLTPALAEQEQLPIQQGALIVAGEGESAIVPGSPAAAVGLQEGDIILEINGIKLDEKNSLARQIRDHTAGTVITLKYWRTGQEHQTQATLGEAPANE